MMIRGNELESQVYELEHVQQVLAEIGANFPRYFQGFTQQPLKPVFQEHIREYEKELETYREYLSLEALDEFESDPNAFKSHTRKQCPIIRRCLMSQDDVMKGYKISFGNVKGRDVLNAARAIADFGRAYVKDFNDDKHEQANTYSVLGLETLNESKYGCPGVIGYGIQSSLLYGLYSRQFAHRSQNAVWSLYFLSGRKDFGLVDGSEFLMAEPERGRCEQNYFYPAELFGFYALKTFLMLKSACAGMSVPLYHHYRYIYLSAFCDYVAETHREDINMLKRSSEYVESHW
jgi:hypothetical protein